MKEHPGKDVDLHQRVLNKYKEGKAFRLFDSGFLKEVEYNGVSVDSDCCFMKARCTHSMSINDVHHTTWVCAAKKSGEIASAYCTCVAGLVPLLYMVFCFKLCCLLSFTRLKLSLNKCCSMRFRVFDVTYYTSLSDFGHCLYKCNWSYGNLFCGFFVCFWLKLISCIFFFTSG